MFEKLKSWFFLQRFNTRFSKPRFLLSSHSLAKVAIEEVARFLENEPSLESVLLVCFSPDDERAFAAEWERRSREG